MKKLFIILTFLSLCPFGATAATVSAKSANCTVNTCDLKLTPEANPYGILLKWNFKQSGYTARIYRNLYQEGDPFIPKSVAASEGQYLDKTADYMKRYEYNIEISDGSDSYKLTATAYAIRGSGMAPKVEKVEVAPLWLVKEGPYNVRVTLNSTYDIQRYEVTEMVFKIAKEDVSLKYDESGIYNLYPKIILDEPGVKELKVQCKYKERSTGKVVPLKNGEGEVKTNAKVFFHKYGKKCNEDKWLEEWKKKALTDLKHFELLTDQLRRKYKKEDKCGLHVPENWRSKEDAGKIEWKKVCEGVSGKVSTGSEIINYEFPEIERCKFVGSKLYIHQDAVSNFKPDIDLGPSGKGIKGAAIVCCHEIIHQDMFNVLQLDDDSKGRYSPSPLNQSALDFIVEQVGRSDCDAKLREYYSVLKDCYAKKNDWYCDKDGDMLFDGIEPNYGLGYGKNSNGVVKDVEYVAYANSSVKGYKGKHKSAKGITISKDGGVANDFAFPGSNIAQEHEGDKREKWKGKVMEDQIALLSNFSRKAPMSSANTSMRLLSVTDEDDDTRWEIPDDGVFSEIDGSAAIDDIEIISVDDGVGYDLFGGVYAGVSFGLKLHTELATNVDVVVGGYLVDENNKPIVSVAKPITVVSGADTDCVLKFPSSYIYRGKYNDYSLKCVTIMSYGGETSILHAFSQNAAGCDRRYVYTDFAPDAGYIHKESATSSMITNGNLEIPIDIEIVSNGVYELSANLYDTNYTYITTARIEDISRLGVQTCRLVFSGRDIYLSKADGPYELYDIELRRDGEVVDSGYHLYTTAAYSYRDFADGSETIFADTGSFKREADLVGADGLCDALNFSFAVTNLAPSEVEYVARIYLCGTNDELVCSSTKNVVLSNEVNMVNIPFRGIDIKKRDVEGPYYVSEVAIEDAESGEIVERFKPEQILINRMLSEFGDSPVALNGEATLVEGTGAGTFVVNVPVNAVRPGVVKASAVLVATNGTPVVSAEASREFAAGENGVFTLSFNAADINATGVRGPYVVKYLCLSTGYEGADEVHVDDLGLGVLNRQFTLYVDCAKKDDSGDGLTPATAKATIDGAVIVAKPGDLILVADGVYDPFTVDRENIVIRGVNGPQKVIVDGEGVAPCVHFWKWAVGDDGESYKYDASTCVVEGMTLRNGYSAYEGGGIDGGRARNCIITGCFAEKYGGGACGAILENCVVYGNKTDYYGGGAVDCTLYNCTVSRNTARYGYGVVGIVAYNSIIWDNLDSDDYESNYDMYGETVYDESEFHNCCTWPMPDYGEGNINDDPLLAAPEYGNMCLMSNSPCVNAGLVEWVKTETDIFGAPRIQDGAPEMGAVENLFENRICVSASVLGRGEVSPKFVFVEKGGSATFTAIETAGRVFSGFKIDDEIVTREKTITLDEVNAPMSIVAVFNSGDLYVSRAGDDENSGVNWTYAKATIQAAIDEADAGDTIYVGEGVYAPIVTPNLAVTIRSVAGAEKTIIDAKGMGSCVKIGGYGEQDTKLIGFTLRNGYVLGNGGGALGGTLYDCRIENNCACGRGGGLAYAKAIRCVISGNKVVSNPGQVWGEGGGAYGCELDNCLVVSNTIYAADDEYVRIGGGGVSGFSLYNCTVADNHIVPSKSGISFSAEGGGIHSAACYNTISWNNSITGVMSNAEGAYISDTLWADEDPHFVGQGNYALAPDSPCIDVGDNDDVKGEMDIAGNMRILGGTVDLGAYEYSEVPMRFECTVRFDANGGDGEMPSIRVAYGIATNLPANAFSWVGHMFTGWAETPNGEVIYRNMGEIVNLVEDGEITLYACWNPVGSLGVQFVDSKIVVNEGETAIIRISGSGKNPGGGNVSLYLVYNTAATADIDLKNALEWNTYGTPIGGVKFPWLLTWGAEHVGENVLEIPIKADKAVEGDEFFTLQLADAHGQSLGEDRVCTVIVHDPGYDVLETKIKAGTASKAEQTAWDKLQKAKVPYIRGLADPANAGKVSGSALCPAGKKVTLKATANKNFTFIGWRDASGDVVAATATLVIDKSAKPAANTKTSTTLTGISGDATYYAMFKSDPSVMVEVYATDGTGAELTGKGAGKYVAGTITGEGKYAPGKKVTLKATANKGYVFSSWQWCDDETEPYYNRYSQEPSLSFTMMDSDVPVFAQFVTTEQDAEYGIGLLLGDEWAEGGLFADSTLRCGIAVNWPIAVDALSATTIKVAGLPAGLKLVQDKDTKEYRVEGVPTAVSKTNTKTGEVVPSVVKFTVTTAGKTTRTFSKSIVVKPLPQWAYGTFNGSIGHRLGADDDYRFDGHGTITMTVSAAGKISGKVALGGTNYTFSANGYSEWSSVEEDDSDAYLMVDVAAKSGKATIPVVLYGYRENQWLSEETENVANCVLWGDGEECGGYDIELRRDLWKDAGNAAALLAWAGAYTYVTDDGDVLSLVVDEKGAVKVTGLLGVKRKVSVSAPLHPYFIDVYVPPTKTDAAFFKRVYLANWHGEAMAGEDTAYRDAGVVLATESLDGTGGGTIAANPKYGQVAVGKSFTLTAKAAKDSVFVKWMYEDEDGEWTYDYSSTLKLVGTGYDIYVRAVFAAKENVTPPEPYVEDWECWNHAVAGRDFTGVVLVDDTARPVSFSAKNLPTGLKIDKTTGVISGTPTKAFYDIITVTATSTVNSKKTGSVEIPMKVRDANAVPEWLSGTFNGYISDTSAETGNRGLERGLFTAAIAQDGMVSVEMKTGYGLVSFNPTGSTPTTWDYVGWEDGYAEVTMTGSNGEQLWLTVRGDLNWDECELEGYVTGGVFGEAELQVIGDRYEFAKVDGKYVHTDMSYFSDELVGTWNLYVYERYGAGVPDSAGRVYPFTHELETWGETVGTPSIQVTVKDNGMADIRGSFLGETISGTVPILVWWCDDEDDCYTAIFWQRLESGKECCIWVDMRSHRETGETRVCGEAWLCEDNESSMSDVELLQLQFKVELTGIAVVDSNEVFYDKAALSKVSFLPPQTPVVVPKGKIVLFELSYDFPDGYGANLWIHGIWPVDDIGSTYNNPSSFYYDRGIAYGFIGIDGCRKTCTIESVSINTGARLLDDDDKTTYWRIGIKPVNITFKK